MRTGSGQETLFEPGILARASIDDLLTVLGCDLMRSTGYAWLQLAAEEEAWLPSQQELLDELERRGVTLGLAGQHVA
jgi:hypothetical protein